MRNLAILFMLLLTLSGCDFKSAKDYVAEGDKLAEEGKYNESSEMYSKAIAIDDKSLAAYINRGANKSELGDTKGAIGDYAKAVEIDSANTLALFNLGNSYKRLEDSHRAVEFYNKALKTKGGPSIYIDVVAVPNSLFNLSGKEFDVPTHEIMYERGIAYYQIDSLQIAYDDFNMAKSNKYMVAESCYWIGLIYLSMGQADLACESFEKAKKMGDKDAEVALKEYCGE